MYTNKQTRIIPINKQKMYTNTTIHNINSTVSGNYIFFYDKTNVLKGGFYGQKINKQNVEI